VPEISDLVELLRLPAVLSLPGDTLLGAAASGGVSGIRRTVGLVGASSCLYLAGMALNDYSDREIDAKERPHRPIPSGRVSPKFALRLAQGLTAAGLTSAAWGGGVHAVAVAAPLAGAVWAYDTVLKGSSAGPAAMALCRSLDVLLGANQGHLADALAPAAVVGTHILKVTLVSRQEVTGGGSGLAVGALAGTAAVTGLAALVAGRSRRRSVLRSIAAVGLLGGFATQLANAEQAAVRDPSPTQLQRVVGAGVLGLIPLEAGMLASTGPPWATTFVGMLWPLARRLSRRKAIT
jgi:4-hydroxybenzoate polyprenyltransferase